MKMLMIAAACAAAAFAAGAYHFLAPEPAPAPDPMERALIVGVEDHYPPFSYREKNGTRAGFDYDMAKAVCQEMKVVCTIVALPFSDLLSKLQHKDIDMVVAGLGPLPERKKIFAFSETYYRSRSFFITNDPALVPVREADPKALVIGAQAETLQASLLEKDYATKGATVRTYPLYKDAVEALRHGEINVLLTDGLPGYALLKHPVGQHFMIGGNYGKLDPCLTDGQIAVNLDEKALIPHINEALIKLQANGRYQELSMRYFPYMNY